MFCKEKIDFYFSLKSCNYFFANLIDLSLQNLLKTPLKFKKLSCYLIYMSIFERQGNHRKFIDAHLIFLFTNNITVLAIATVIQKGHLASPTKWHWLSNSPLVKKISLRREPQTRSVNKAQRESLMTGTHTLPKWKLLVSL